MKFIDLNELVSEEAILQHGETEHILKEPNGYKWAEFSNRIENIKEEDIESIIELKKWIVSTIIPTLDQDLLTPSEFVNVAEVCQIVFNGGVSKLGKKVETPVSDNKDKVKKGKTETVVNFSYFIAKGLKAGLSLKEVEEMPYRKLLAIISGSKASYSEDMIDLLHIVANPSLLEGKKSRVNYPKLFKTFEKIVKENGIKTVTIDADFDQLVAMKTLQEEERRKRK